jgi:hypothetical protein
MKISNVSLKMLFIMAVSYGPSPLPLVAQTAGLKPVVSELELKAERLP